MLKEIIINATTGEETIIEFSAEELLEIQEKQAKYQATIEAEIEAQAEKQALKDSANAKLAVLGLTPEEISAITGA
tara:strand:- start:2147 stop:2374 length:228 start_codon:yes stop_codon:yes gene_type:complete